MSQVIVRRFVHEPRIQGYRFFWIKYVQGVDLAEHCQKCLLGPVSKVLGTRHVKGAAKRVVLRDIELIEAPAKFLYLCGVTEPYLWSRNYHLALKVEPGAPTFISKGYGLELEIEGAVPVPIVGDHMDRTYPRYSEKWYRTCRNAQFAWGFHVHAYEDSEGDHGDGANGTQINLTDGGRHDHQRSPSGQLF